MYARSVLIRECDETLIAGYYTSTYTLPQVFFGKDLIGGYEEIHGKRDGVHIRVQEQLRV